MLIEFSVQNFRSFRDKQTLSMVAASRLRKRENVFKPLLDGEDFPALLKVAVIYGPNASGKSNFLRALDVILYLVHHKASSSTRPMPVSPFCFDEKLTDQPSIFDVHFIHAGMRYQFEIHLTDQRIVLERLTFFPKGQESLLYNRAYENGADQYTFGQFFETNSVLQDAWKKLTPSRSLFLVQAGINSSDDLKLLRMPLEWLRDGISTVMQGAAQYSKYSLGLAEEHHQYADEIASFLRDVDVPISKINIKRPAHISGAPTSDDEESTSSVSSRTTLTHSTSIGEAELSYADESDGTKSLIGFWLPWSTRHPHMGKAFCVLAVDELDSSLHPKIVEALVAKHQNAEIPSQLIFTTHDTHLMDSKLLRRDQIWITERDAAGATQLRSIHDFEGRESEDIEKRYYEGRYRGLPFVRS